MNFINNLSIKSKLIGIILTVTFLSLLLSNLFVLSVDIEKIKYELKDRAILTAKLISEYSVPPILFNDNDGAESVLAKLETNEDVLYCILYDENNNLFAHYGQENSVVKIESPWTGFNDNDVAQYISGFLHVYFPVESEGKNYGAVYLILSTDSVDNKILYRLKLTFLVFFFVLAFAIAVTLWLQKTISQPIIYLSDIANRISKHPDYSIRVETKGRDEIGNLYNQFNSMLEQLYIRSNERDVAEKKLRDEKEFTDGALNAQMDTFFVFNPGTGKAIRWNKSFEKLSGYSSEEIARLPAPMSYYESNDLIKTDNVIKVVNEKGFGSVELDLICKNGSRISTEYFVTSIGDEEGATKYFISIGRDIRGRKKIEKELQTHRDDLEKLVEIRTHELEMKNMELKDMNYELEQFNKLFTGREFRIKELKNEIAELKNKLK